MEDREINCRHEGSISFHPVGVRISRPLCRDPHVLLEDKAEPDCGLIVVVDPDHLPPCASAMCCAYSKGELQSLPQNMHLVGPSGNKTPPFAFSMISGGSSAIFWFSVGICPFPGILFSSIFIRCCAANRIGSLLVDTQRKTRWQYFRKRY